MSKNRIAYALGLTGLLGASLAGVTFQATAASGYETPRTREVRVDDDCDPATFNAVLGAGACVGDGDTTFQRFIEELLGDGGHDAWRNRPVTLDVAHGDAVRARNIGGEFHTFTEVAEFGGGCVPELNGPLGLTPVPECADPTAIPTTGVVPGGSLAVPPLHEGTHKFQCLIHPWMRTTAHVGHDS